MAVAQYGVFSAPEAVATCHVMEEEGCALNVILGGSVTL